MWARSVFRDDPHDLKHTMKCSSGDDDSLGQEWNGSPIPSFLSGESRTEEPGGLQSTGSRGGRRDPAAQRRRHAEGGGQPGVLRRCAVASSLFLLLRQVHQHQDRGETFQCQLCPFTSSRHFSLKLHMRCHQHFLRTEAKVKEELPDPEAKGPPHLSDSSCLGQQREGGGTELAGTMMKPSTPERTSQGGAGVSPSLVKEEPKEDNGLPTSFPLNATDRPANHTKLREPSEFAANSASALFSQDISVKMASDFLMKLSGT